MKYELADGGKIEINDTGNTYIGEAAHKVMFSAWGYSGRFTTSSKSYQNISRS